VPAGRTYDRDLLLFGAKRDAVLELWEVERYGTDSFGDPAYVSIYGKRPKDWYAAGVRLLGRTVVECTRDELAGAIAMDIAAVAASAPEPAGAVVIDPFAGSGNTLYWILRNLPDARGYGFEIDPAIFRLTGRNLQALAAPIEFLNVDYVAGLRTISVPAGRMVVAFVAPPWGDALDPGSGLDLRRTAPPIPSIVDKLAERFAANPLIVAVQVYERVDPDALAEVARRLEWSSLRVFELNAEGENHGILLGTRGWTPG